MTELREEKGVPETTEQVGKRILEFVENTEFGSPEYQAISDYVLIKNLEGSLTAELRNVRSDIKSSEGRDLWESKARVREQEIALHRAQIYHQQSCLKGYDTAFTFIEIRFEDTVSGVARREAESLYPKDLNHQEFYRNDTLSRYFGKVEEIIHQKRTNSTV
jgi:hypothetical protein